MTKFIQLPQAGSALPLILNYKDIHRVRFSNEGTPKITLMVYDPIAKEVEKVEARYTSAEEALATYWRLHALLSPTPMGLPLN